MIVRENIEFTRASSDRGIKEKLFGWRPGQILIAGEGYSRLMAFVGIEEKSSSIVYPDKAWNIKCLEIGHISGSAKIAYIHFGFTQNILLKKKSDLRMVTEEEAAAIQKAMIDPDYKKYIQKAEEKIGTKLLVW
jgi:hypothetical protein